MVSKVFFIILLCIALPFWTSTNPEAVSPTFAIGSEEQKSNYPIRSDSHRLKERGSLKHTVDHVDDIQEYSLGEKSNNHTKKNSKRNFLFIKNRNISPDKSLSPDSPNIKEKKRDPLELESGQIHSEINPPNNDNTNKEYQIPTVESEKPPIESILSSKWLNLGATNSYSPLDSNEIADNIRKQLNLKKSVNLHLERQNLIKENCDLASFGPQYCAKDKKAEMTLWQLEHRKNSTILLIAIFVIISTIFVQLLIGQIEKTNSYQTDLFSKDVMNAAYKQIAIISIVSISLWILLQTNFAVALDKLFFGDVIPEERNVDKLLSNHEPLLQVLFGEIFFISVIFLIWYVIYVTVLHLSVEYLVRWVHRIDESNVVLVAKEALHQRRSCCAVLCCSQIYSKANFLAHRYEFCDSVVTMSIPGVDPSSYYFADYIRASLLRTVLGILRIPNMSLIFLIFVGIILRPTYSFRLLQEVYLIVFLSSVCLLWMILTWIYAKKIERKLLPRFVPDYLIKRYQLDCDGKIDDEVQDILKPYNPPYKLQKQKSAMPTCLTKFFFGTTFPNLHEQLFCFWQRGPDILLRSFDMSSVSQLIVLSWWVYLVRSHPITWFKLFWWWNIIIIGIIIVHFGLLKSVFWTIHITTKTGLLIDSSLLEKVWEIQRTESVRRITEFVDILRTKSTLYSLIEEGEMAWKNIMAQVDTMSNDVKSHLDKTWASLDELEQGDINVTTIYSYLIGLGLCLKSEYDVYEFLQFFDRDRKGGIDRQQFYALSIVVRKMISTTLNVDAVKMFFISNFNVVWSDSPCIDIHKLSFILQKLNLHWTEGQRRHLLDFIGGKRNTDAVSAENLLNQLLKLESGTLKSLNQTIDDFHKGLV